MLQAKLNQDEDYVIDDDSDCESEGECAVTFAKPRTVICMTRELHVARSSCASKIETKNLESPICRLCTAN